MAAHDYLEAATSARVALDIFCEPAPDSLDTAMDSDAGYSGPTRKFSRRTTSMVGEDCCQDGTEPPAHSAFGLG